MYFILFIFSGISIVNPNIAPLTFIISLLSYLQIYRKYKTTLESWPQIYLLLMVYSLPFSWVSFLGISYNVIPISWFNIFGILYLFSILLSAKKNILKSKAFLFVIAFVITIISILPIFYSENILKSDALTQLITITFHNLLILFSLFIYGSISQKNIQHFINGYTKGVYFTSIMLFVQFISIKYINFNFGIVKYYLNRESLMYIFGDASHGSLYLSTGTFLIFMQIFDSKKRTPKMFLELIIMFSGVALTSARTGLFVLIGFVGIYVIFNLKTFFQKTIGLLGSIFLLLIANKSMTAVRNIENTNLFDSSGRLEGYVASFEVLKKSPIIGYGYGQSNLVNILGFPIPHLSILQYAMHVGVLITFGLFLVQLLVLIDSKQKNSMFFWCIAITLVGTCLIPDLFATRFISLLCILSIVELSENEYNLLYNDN